MKRIFLLFLATVNAQSQTPTWTPSATPMGTSMLTYALRFPNSDPGSAVRPDHLAYLITAIACSANVPIELVFISYIRANDNYVAFKQAQHNTTGLVQGCATLAAPRSLRSLQIVATPNMLVMIYYLSPRAANPTDSYFQAYASVIAGSAAPATLDANSNGPGSGSVSGSGSGSSSISTGAIVGIVMGALAATALAAGAFALYAKRRRHSYPPPLPLPTATTKIKWMNSPISIR